MKHFFLTLITLLFVAGEARTQIILWDENADSNWNPVASGYRIETAAQLAQLAYLVNNGETFEDATFTLTADIDLSEYYWIAIGEEASLPFRNVFDGNGHSIKGLKIDNTRSDYYGVYSALFGRVGSGAEIKNLSLTDGEIRGSMGDGAFSAALIADAVADNTQPILILNCQNSGVKVIAGGGTRDAYTAGLIASAKTLPEENGNGKIDIRNCSNKAPVTGVCTSNFIGGLIGWLSTEGDASQIAVDECFSETEINTSRDFAGGLIGRVLAKGNTSITIENSHVSGTVKGIGGCTGGLIGRATAQDDATATISNCFVSLTELKGGEFNTNPLVGKNDNAILSNNEER
jgi:hypothetical protein